MKKLNFHLFVSPSLLLALATGVISCTEKTSVGGGGGGGSGGGYTAFLTEADFPKPGTTVSSSTSLNYFELNLATLLLSNRGQRVEYSDSMEEEQSQESVEKEKEYSDCYDNLSKTVKLGSSSAEVIAQYDVDDTACEKIYDDPEYTTTTKSTGKLLDVTFCKGYDFSSLVKNPKADFEFPKCEPSGSTFINLADSKSFLEKDYSNPSSTTKIKKDRINRYFIGADFSTPCTFETSGALQKYTSNCITKSITINGEEVTTSYLTVSKGATWDKSATAKYYSSGTGDFEFEGGKGKVTFKGATTAPTYTGTWNGAAVSGTLRSIDEILADLNSEDGLNLHAKDWLKEVKLPKRRSF